MLSELQISAIRAREVLDCRGLPTVQVDVVVDDTFLGRADVPAGVTGRGPGPAPGVPGGDERTGLSVIVWPQARAWPQRSPTECT